ncbi:hypothetical protein M422DRAFT_275649 [Sphaerobolus stellatus SS14]|uniref:Uncharacterized protein n=1 Tax=Sphaerobolus stellatus (strain SS14) TaxID=990650 RepID=A0A0C9UE09_SPHS4|nr:hypothetical protein M422DRAFT_275649 [Sphaerobolus stellatus SS14]
MSTCCNHKQVEKLSAQAVGEDKPIPELTSGELTDPLPPDSVDPQQSVKVFAQEHLSDPSMRVHGPQPVPARIQSPIGVASAAGASAPSPCLLRVAQALSTATQVKIPLGESFPVQIQGMTSVGPLMNLIMHILMKEEPVSVNNSNRNNISVAQAIQGIPESIKCSQHSMGETQSIDMNALREEIKETISATIKEKLHSDADSITTVSHSMTALDANAQYWSDLSNKAMCCSCRALELQLKMVEEKVNTLLYEEAPKEVLLEAA